MVPRHPVRGPEIAALLRARGLRFARRSAGESIGDDTELYLADTLGELGLLFRLAGIAFIGGIETRALKAQNDIIAQDGEAAVAIVRSIARPGDLVLVKASRVARLERVAGALRGEDADRARPDGAAA